MCSVKKIIVGNQTKSKQTNIDKNKQTNLEHGEVNLQMKRACLCTQRSNLIEEIWCSPTNVQTKYKKKKNL